MDVGPQAEGREEMGAPPQDEQGRLARRMRMLEIHVCPLWEADDGEYIVGPEHCASHPPVVGWAAAALIILGGGSRWFLLTLDA